MKVNDVFDIFGGILVLALVATILTKPNTAADVNAAGRPVHRRAEGRRGRVVAE